MHKKCCAKCRNANAEMQMQSLNITNYVYFGNLAKIPGFMNNRIVGGEQAPSMIPWQVYIFGCGGTILDKCTILSAAHCGFQAGGKIRAGSRNKFSGGEVILLSSVFKNSFKKQINYSYIII